MYLRSFILEVYIKRCVCLEEVEINFGGRKMEGGSEGGKVRGRKEEGGEK